MLYLEAVALSLFIVTRWSSPGGIEASPDGAEV